MWQETKEQGGAAESRSAHRSGWGSAPRGAGEEEEEEEGLMTTSWSESSHWQLQHSHRSLKQEGMRPGRRLWLGHVTRYIARAINQKTESFLVLLLSSLHHLLHLSRRSFRRVHTELSSFQSEFLFKRFSEAFINPNWVTARLHVGSLSFINDAIMKTKNLIPVDFTEIPPQQGSTRRQWKGTPTVTMYQLA